LPADLPAVNLLIPIALATGDAFVFDHADRDLPRVLWKPSAEADGYNPDSKRKLHGRSVAMATEPGSMTSKSTRSETRLRR